MERESEAPRASEAGLQSALSLADTNQRRDEVAVIINRHLHELAVDDALSALSTLLADSANEKWGRLPAHVKTAVTKVVKFFADDPLRQLLTANQALDALSALALMVVCGRCNRQPRPPSWLQTKWIQTLLAQAIMGHRQQDDDRDNAKEQGQAVSDLNAEAVASLLQTVAQLRYVPSAQEAACMKAMVERHAAHLPAEKTKQLMHLAKSIHVDFPAYPAEKNHRQYPYQTPGQPSSGGLAVAEGPRFYNFDQLVEALGCAQPNYAAGSENGADVDIEPSGGEHGNVGQSQTWDLASAAGTVSPYDSARTTSAMGSGGATDVEHGGAEMFGRRKLQLVLDVSRVADIKIGAGQGQTQRFIPLSCPLLANSCSWSIGAKEPEADVETNSLGKGVDKNNAMAHHINLSSSTHEQNAPRVEDWLTVDMMMPQTSSTKGKGLCKSVRSQNGSNRRLHLVCTKWLPKNTSSPFALLMSFNTEGISTGTTLKAVIKVKFDGTHVVVRPRMVDINIEVLVSDALVSPDLPFTKLDTEYQEERENVSMNKQQGVKMVKHSARQGEQETKDVYERDALEADACAVLSIAANLLLQPAEALLFDMPLPINRLERRGAIHDRALVLSLQWVPLPFDAKILHAFFNYKLLLQEVATIVHREVCRGSLVPAPMQGVLLLQNLHHLASRCRMHTQGPDALQESMHGTVISLESSILLVHNTAMQCLNMPYGLGSSGFLCPQIQQEHNNFNAPDPPNAFADMGKPFKYVAPPAWEPPIKMQRNICAPGGGVAPYPLGGEAYMPDPRMGPAYFSTATPELTVPLNAAAIAGGFPAALHPIMHPDALMKIYSAPKNARNPNQPFNPNPRHLPRILIHPQKMQQMQQVMGISPVGVFPQHAPPPGVFAYAPPLMGNGLLVGDGYYGGDDYTGWAAAPLSSSAMTSSTGSFGSCTSVFGGQQRSAFVSVTGASSRRRHRRRQRSGSRGSVLEGD